MKSNSRYFEQIIAIPTTDKFGIRSTTYLIKDIEKDRIISLIINSYGDSFKTFEFLSKIDSVSAKICLYYILKKYNYEVDINIAGIDNLCTYTNPDKIICGTIKLYSNALYAYKDVIYMGQHKYEIMQKQDNYNSNHISLFIRNNYGDLLFIKGFKYNRYFYFSIYGVKCKISFLTKLFSKLLNNDNIKIVRRCGYDYRYGITIN